MTWVESCTCGEQKPFLTEKEEEIHRAVSVLEEIGPAHTSLTTSVHRANHGYLPKLPLNSVVGWEREQQLRKEGEHLGVTLTFLFHIQSVHECSPLYLQNVSRN